jgi:hypothetical protein
LKPFAKSFGTKLYRKSSYTIPKGPPEETRAKQIKAKINAFNLK